MHSAFCIVHCKMCKMKFTPYNIVHEMHKMFYCNSVECPRNSLHCTVYSDQCTVESLYNCPPSQLSVNIVMESEIREMFLIQVTFSKHNWLLELCSTFNFFSQQQANQKVLLPRAFAFDQGIFALRAKKYIFFF